MYHLRKRGTWFGMLQSKKGNAVVIWDSVLPKAEKGKVLLFNTSKDALVEYVEEIVQPKLRDLTGKEQSDANAQFGERWQSIRQEYVPDEPEEEESPKSATNRIDMDDEIEPNMEDDDLGLDEDFEDL